MLLIIETLYILLVVIVAIPVGYFALQILLSMLPYRARLSALGREASTPTVTILIPAHNESSGIIATLDSIKRQQTSQVKIVVIADNCSDDTAAVARKWGAEVIERFDSSLRGKGYALDFGVTHLRADPPDVVLILDADCVISEGSIQRLVADAVCYSRPIQGLYLMKSAQATSLKAKIAEFAWTVKNWARPLGLHRVALPCQLMGSGMAFPWTVISQVDLASGHIVEDMKLGVDLAKLGLAPRFCPEALVTSDFPNNEEGVKTQRTRWEHGHIGMILKEGPALIMQGIKQANINVLALALDMCIPPLALLVLAIMALTGLSVLLALLTQQIWPWAIALVELLTVGATVILAWWKYGRSSLAFTTLLLAPVYMLMKIPLYIKFIFKRQSEWIRSKRD